MSAGKRPSPPPKQWLHGLCTCCDDPSLCCTVFWCSPNATGQAYQRMTKRTSACLLVAVGGWALVIATQIFSQTGNALGNTAVERDCVGSLCVERTNWDRVAIANTLGAIGGIVGLASSVYFTYFVCTSRRMIRERDGIPEGCCSGCDDCCVAYWCMCCALVQFFRQERVHHYRLCEPTGVQAV